MNRSLWVFSSLDWINPVLSTFLHISSSPSSSHLGGPPLDVLQFFIFSWTGENQHWVLPTSCLPSLMSSTGTFSWTWKCHLGLNLGMDKIIHLSSLFFFSSVPVFPCLNILGVCFDLYFLSYSMRTSCRKYLQIRNQAKCIFPYSY